MKSYRVASEGFDRYINSYGSYATTNELLGPRGGWQPREEVVASAGALRSPQLLMLSGIGPAAHLREMGIKMLVDLPAVGRGLHDHLSFFQHWRLREPGVGYTLNPLFRQPEFALGVPVNWSVNTDVAGRDKAAAEDRAADGIADEAQLRQLLASSYNSTIETVLLYFKLPLPGIPVDAYHLTTMMLLFLPTSRGSVTLRSGDAEDGPKSEAF
ncbi:GMC oxidoreductase-domain-containing protein [Xylariaceae sp. FL0804]|nr:GMC oxidoreductase-domain-containing protein [Xylariaceae sp. FL0804]